MSQPTSELVVTGGTLVDPRDGSTRPATIHIAGGRVTAVTDEAYAGPAPTVDATGLFVAPGFNDMHAHPLNRPDGAEGVLAMMLAHGITGVRQMSGSPTVLRRRAEGTLRLPEDAPAILEIPGTVLTPGNAATGPQARATVREQAEAGADFIKAALTTPEVFAEAQDEARRIGIPILGHLPGGMDPVAAAEGGLRSIEHLGPALGLLSCCSTDHEHVLPASRGRALPTPPTINLPFVRPLLDRVMAAMLERIVINPANINQAPDIALTAHAIATFDDGLATELAETLVAHGVWQVPTMIRSLSQFRCDDARFTDDPDLRYVNAGSLKRWRKANEKFLRFTPEQRATFAAAYDRLLELAGIFDRAGSRMLAGSDSCGGGWLVAGPSLHHEFDELARAGLSPLTVLQMTTSNVVDYLGRDDAPGVVEPGRPADLVLLGANPVEDVANLHAVEGVVRAGKAYAAADLAALKERVAADRSVF